MACTRGRPRKPPPADQSGEQFTILRLTREFLGYQESMATRSARRAASEEFHAARPSIVRVARLGWFAKGVVYLLAGILAVSLATRSARWSAPQLNGEASPTGAIKELATLRGGRELLYALGTGLILYSGWRFYTAFARGGGGAEAMAKRVGYGFSAVLYLTFALTSFALARHPRANPNGNTKVSDITTRILDQNLGRWIVGACGVIGIAVGVYRFRKGVIGDVEDELNLSTISAARRHWLHRLGVVGEIGRGVAIALIGFFLLRASMTVNAQEATGLDGALRRLAKQTWGAMVVAIVGVGFVAYGIFCLLTFNHRQLQAPS
jgi:Domain of Unknown Function (DUF1206)